MGGVSPGLPDGAADLMEFVAENNDIIFWLAMRTKKH